MDKTKISKFLSLVLRHQPQTVGLDLDENGWVDIESLILGARKAGTNFSREELEQIVKESDKQRFIIDGDMIRANQGHSVNVNLELKHLEPPELLYHGTVRKFMEEISKKGLKKMNRHHVHLSPDIVTAEKVGSRRGTPIILKIDSAAMYRDGHKFMCSKNGVWLIDSVPSSYINIISRDNYRDASI
ncbi:RNA 2'-phosphotransferase [bacterium]|nr:RNA 2'-phosphotransferase [bacterium]